METTDGNGSSFQSIAESVSRRRLLQGALLGGATLGLGPLLDACSSNAKSSGSSSSSGSPRNGGHLRVGMTDFASNDTLDPQLAGTHESNEALNFNTFDRLFAFSPDQKQVVPQLASHYAANSDATQFTVRLRDGLTFHSGKHVTADDVVFSYQRMMDPKHPKSLTPLLAGVKQVKKLDKLTVRFTLSGPDAVFQETLAHYAASILPVGFVADGTAKSLNGTGPFKVDSWIQGRQADFSPFADYYGQVPHVDQMTWFSYNDPTAQMNALQSDAIDWATAIQPTQVATLSKGQGLAAFMTDSGGYTPFCMRVDQAPFTDVRVRQAFKLVVDRPQMIESTVSGLAALGNDMYGRFDPSYPSNLPQRAQDIAQARSLLKQAGYSNGLTIDLNTSNGVGPFAVAAATVFAEQASKAGIKVNVKNLDSNVLYGNQWLSWTFSMDVWGTRSYLATAMLATLPGAPWNETHWNDPTWTALVRKALASVDQTARNNLVQQAQKIEYDKGGYIIWSFPKLIDGQSTKVGGAVHDTFLTSACGWRFNQLYFV